MMLPPSDDLEWAARWSRLLLDVGIDARRFARGAMAEGEQPIWPPKAAIRAVHAEAPGGASVGRGDGEVRLWTTLERYQTFDAASASELLTAERLADVSGFELRGTGPLWRQDEWDALEVWTEAELCGLHGLWRAWRVFAVQAAGAAGATSDAALLAARIRAAILWHLEYTQPDNATNRPWATHVFLAFAAKGGDQAGDARLYAETLLHNAQAQGMADPATAWILTDAGRELGLCSARRGWASGGADGHCG